MKKTYLLQGAGGILISTLGLLIFFKSVDTTVLWKEICKTEKWIIAAVVVLNPLTIWFRALRWKVILSANSEHKSKNDLFSITMISFMLNNLFPARLGEAARIVLLWRRNGFTIMESAGSLAVERGLDALLYSAFFFIPVFGKSSLASLQPYAVLMIAAFAVSILLLIIYSRSKARAVKIIGSKILALVPHKLKNRVQKISKELISNLEWIFSWHRALRVVLYSILMMSCYAFMMYFLAWGLSEFNILDSMFGVSMAALGAAIPLSPGYIGTLHSSLLQGLGMIGVMENKAGAIAVLYHGIGYTTITAMGLMFLMSMKVSIKELRKAKEELKKE